MSVPRKRRQSLLIAHAVGVTLLLPLLVAADESAPGRSPDDRAAIGTSKRADPDAPRGPIVETERFLRERDAWVMMRRGLPYPAGRRNPRADAIREMEAQERKRYGALAKSQFLPHTSAAINSMTWTAVGPAPIPAGQTNGTRVPVSGLVMCLAIHPTDANIVYAGTAAGGVYRTTDGGSSWTALMDGADSLAIGSIAIDPKNPSTIIVGTGAGDSYYGNFGVGLYRITGADGATPVVEGPYKLNAVGADVFTGNSIPKVLVNPVDDNIVYVATTDGYGGRTLLIQRQPLIARGLFRSTNFMSASPTFTQLPITTANGGDRRVTDMVFDPGDPETLILNLGGGSEGGLYRVTKASGLNPTFTQTLVINGDYTARLAINKVGSTVTVLAATEENACVQSGGTLRRSNDGGQTWPDVIATANGFCGGQCFYDIGVAIHPTNAGAILVGGTYDDTVVDPCRSSTLLRSTDGGLTFPRSSANLHADTHVIQFAPSNPAIVYTGDDGGVFRSIDSGLTWTSINAAGFSATQFNTFVSHPLDRYFGIGGTQDNGTNLTDFGGSWIHGDDGDGGYALIDGNATDAISPFLMYHTYYNYPSQQIGFARVATLADANPDGWSFYGNASYAINNGLGNDPVLFYAPMALGPGAPNTLYFGTDRLYRSSNSGLKMSVTGPAPLVAGRRIVSIAVSPQDDNVRVVGLTNGNVFAQTNGSNTLTDISGTLPAAAGPVPVPVGEVAIDPNNKNVAYVTYSTFGLPAGHAVWKNINLSGAGAWASAGNGIPDVPVNAIVIDPRNSSNLYVGTDIGVYNSMDGGNNWSPFAAGMPRVPVFDLDIQDQSRVLRAATYGRGIFEIMIPGAQRPALSIGQVTTVPTVGNGNGVLEPGENAAVTVPITNHGVVAATNVSVSISTITPGVTILNGTSSIPDVAAGGSASNAVPLTFNVAPTVPCGTALQFTVTVSAAATPPTTKPLRVALGSTSGSAITFPYTGAVAAIPDNNVNGVVAPVTVSGVTAPIAKVTLTIGGSVCNTTVGSPTVGIDHTWVGNLQIYLTSPAGTVVPLTLNRGGSGNNLCGTTFDDAAPTAFSTVTYTQPPYTGTFRPETPLSAFAGENANGTWQLNVVDGFSFDTGSVRAFSLTIAPATCTPACPQITLAPSLLPAATINTAYSQPITASGGAGPYTFTTSSTLPAGVTLTSAGLLAGTPTQSGSFPLDVIATASNGCIGTGSYTLLVVSGVLPTPANVVATATSGTDVSATWDAVIGAQHYEVYRSSNNGSAMLAGTPTAPPFPDSGLTGGVTYLYKVKAVSATAISPFSSIDPATTILFDAIVPNVTKITAAQFTAMRNGANALRAAFGIAPFTFTNAITTSATIRAADLNELRQAVAPALTALGRAATFTDDPAVAGTTGVRAVHVQEIQNAIK